MKFFKKENKSGDNILHSQLFVNFEKKTFSENLEFIPHNTIELYKHGSVDVVDKIILQLSILKRVLDETAIVAMTDKDGNITYVNNKFCEISKYQKEELLGQNHRILKSGYHPSAFYAGMWKTISSGHIWKGEIKNKAKDGTFYWVKTLIFPLLNDKGTPSEYISVRVDITKEKEIQEELEKLEKLYKDLYDQSPDLYRSVNSKGIIVNCNDSLAKRLGCTKTEIIGTSVFDWVSPQHLVTQKDIFEEWLRKRNISNKEMWLRTKDGKDFPVLISANTRNVGEDFESISVIKDITELHDAKQKIADLKASKLVVVGELAARIAHDIRNPLTTIKNSLDLLAMKLGPRLSENELEYIDRMKRATDRITHQVDGVLDYVRISPLNVNLHSLRKIIDESLKKLDIPQNVKIYITAESDLELFCDNEKMEIVFTNLIINAIHAISKELGHIDIHLKKESDYAIIEIKDSGPPISEHVLEHMFEPLFTTKQIGTGLGLVSVKNIIEQHGGKISVRANPTTFTILLPATQVNQYAK